MALDFKGKHRATNTIKQLAFAASALTSGVGQAIRSGGPPARRAARRADQRSGVVDVVRPVSVSQPEASALLDIVVFEVPPPVPWVAPVVPDAPAQAPPPFWPFWPFDDEAPLVLPRLEPVVAAASLPAEPAVHADEPALS